MNFTEMKAKTGMKIVGISNGISIYTTKDGKQYPSVDLLVQGQRDLIRINLPENYKPEQFQDGSLVQVTVSVSVYNGRTNFNALV